MYYQANKSGIAKCERLLRAHKLVAMPTETVYGLAADARSEVAVAKVFAAKGRPHFNPLIVHIADMQMARDLAYFDARALAVAKAFWPGPLTLIVPLRTPSALAHLVTSNLTSVALRWPAHPVAQELIRAFGGPVAAPSANPSGRVSATRAAHICAELDGKVDAILDGGDCAIGVESTIVDLCGPARILRPGGITAQDLAPYLSEINTLCPAPMASAAHKPNAPGQLISHYAPNAPVRLNVQSPRADEVWVGFGAHCVGAAFNLSMRADVNEAAAQLFSVLRKADARAGGSKTIAFAPLPHTGLGLAINDRLKRAAAPRDHR